MHYLSRYPTVFFLLMSLIYETKSNWIWHCPANVTVPLNDTDRIFRLTNDSRYEDLLRPVGPHSHIRNVSINGYVCACDIKSCVRKCCQDDEVLSESARPECIKLPRNSTFIDLRPEKDQLAPELQDMKGLRERFIVINDRSCSAAGTYRLEPDSYEEDRFLLQANGTLLATGSLLPMWNYCMDWHESMKKLTVLVCLVPEEPSAELKNETVYRIGMLISVPFLFATFLVYAIIPELRNIYGKTLMCYVLCLVAAYIFLVVAGFRYLQPNLCTTIAFIIHFSFLASFFWLNVMCFDIWWTFGGFRSLQGSVKQRERKKFIMYSIYAWGSATILTGICVIMDFVPSVPKSFIRPQFGSSRCWFTTENAKAIYFYGPVGITVLCNICLFISTALKIVHHKKDTAHHLKGSESRRHDDNKQWFNLYLKLFIVMGINWSMEIVSWICKGCPAYLWYITDLANTLQGIIIFVIFVWKDKIKRLLLKRFGCLDRSVLSRNSTRSAYHSSTSRTCTTAAPLQEKVNPYVHENYRTRAAMTDDSDCA